MFKKQKGFIGVVAVSVAVCFLVFVVAGVFFVMNMRRPAVLDFAPAQGACPQEAKICPDGSSVFRRGSACEFDVCPAPVAPVPRPTPRAGVACVMDSDCHSAQYVCQKAVGASSSAKGVCKVK